MTPWWWFVLGALVGWLVELVIDWIYWRRRQSAFVGEIAALRESEQKLRAEWDSGRKAIQRMQDELRPLRADNDRLKAELAGLSTVRADAERLRVELRTTGEATARCNAEADALKVRVASLVGEGDQLRMELAARGPALEQLQAELAARATELEGLRVELAARHGELTQVQSDLVTRHGEVDQVRTELAARHDDLAHVRTDFASREVELARLRSDLSMRDSELEQLRMATPPAPVTEPPVASADETELASLRLDLERLRGRNDRLNLSLRSERAVPVGERPAGADPLLAIDGIGPVYQQRLFENGVLTFGQLAAQSPEQLRTMALGNDDDEIDAEAWIAAAQARLPADRRDPLIDIEGIGPVYERMLFEAGVLTFAQLAALSPEQVTAIIKPKGWQRLDAAAWIAEAQGFAEKVRDGSYTRKEA